MLHKRAKVGIKCMRWAENFKGPNDSGKQQQQQPENFIK